MTTAKRPKAPTDDVSGTDKSILINFVLDKSGSMEPICEATIEGFNKFKNDQMAEDGSAFFTLTLFDTGYYEACVAVPLREVPDLSLETYRPHGLTALYDAVGRSIKATDRFVERNHPDQVLFVIMTDGQENASKEFTHRMIFDMIAECQADRGYEFIYLGANQDSYAVSSQMGIRAGRSMDYAHSPQSSREALLRMSRNVRAYRRRGEAQTEEFFSAEMERLGKMEADEYRKSRDSGADAG